ncbi:MAG: protein phosphatase 2C domain-containing protein [Desulfovibrio sp.]|jgi:serine/threonine protein phosphatase PrpC|nr:protein phosphatase 2C domain-containing protein [Desulfovibrio sp.]
MSDQERNETPSAGTVAARGEGAAAGGPEMAAAEPADPAGPTICLWLRLQGGCWDQRLHNTLKKIIAQAPPLLGAVGKEFSCELDLSVDKYFSLTLSHASGFFAESGLELDFRNPKIHLSGIPKAGFDGPLTFLIRDDGSDRMLSLEKPLYIAADPRTLWRDLPVEDDEGYPVPDEAVEARFLDLTGKVFLAASCRGRYHAHAARPRDDSFALDIDPDTGWHFIAVADGAGSAKFARKGSELACATVIRSLRADLAAQDEDIAGQEDRLRDWKRQCAAGGDSDPERDRDFNSGLKFDAIVHRAVYAAYQAISGEARRKGAAVRDYHTTLLCAAFRKFSFGYFFLCYWVGDGAMALYNGNGGVLVPGIPDGGEFAGQTRFLTMKEEIEAEAIRRRTRCAFAEDFEALLLMTDGVSDPFFPAEKDVAGAENWHAFWQKTLRRGFEDNPGCPRVFDASLPPEERARALRKWLDFWSRGNHDDRTLVLVL